VDAKGIDVMIVNFTGLKSIPKSKNKSGGNTADFDIAYSTDAVQCFGIIHLIIVWITKDAIPI
jgi:hypothetical protein